MKENVEYIKVFADYESDDMPVVYLYEVDLEDERLRSGQLRFLRTGK